jgi:hypothetical protein
MYNTALQVAPTIIKIPISPPPAFPTPENTQYTHGNVIQISSIIA